MVLAVFCLDGLPKNNPAQGERGRGGEWGEWGDGGAGEQEREGDGE